MARNSLKPSAYACTHSRASSSVYSQLNQTHIAKDGRFGRPLLCKHFRFKERLFELHSPFFFTGMSVLSRSLLYTLGTRLIWH